MTNSVKIGAFSPLILVTFLAAFFYLLLEDTKADTLPQELENLQIKNEFIASQSKQVGLISLIKGSGKLVVIHRPKQEAYYAREGNPVYEEDSLYTLDCRCRIEFEDKNVIFMGPETHVDIDEVSSSFFSGQKKSLFGLAKAGYLPPFS